MVGESRPRRAIRPSRVRIGTSSTRTKISSPAIRAWRCRSRRCARGGLRPNRRSLNQCPSTTPRRLHGPSSHALAEAVGAGRGGRGFAAFADQPTAPNSRSAAVLMLFGVLDGLPSDHDAHAHAVSRDLDVLLLAARIDAAVESRPGRLPRRAHRSGGRRIRRRRPSRGRRGDGPRSGGVEVLGALETVPLAFTRHLVTPVLAWWRHPSPVRVVDEAESADVFRAPVADLLDPAREESR